MKVYIKILSILSLAFLVCIITMQMNYDNAINNYKDVISSKEKQIEEWQNKYNAEKQRTLENENV